MWSMIFAILLIIALVVVWDKYFKDIYLAEHGIRPDHYVIPADSPMVSLELRRPGGSSVPIAKKLRAAEAVVGASAKSTPAKAARKSVEKVTRPAKSPAQTQPAKQAASNDLTKIKGIGKVTAAKLAENDITTYEQLASLSEEEFNRLNETIRFRGKVDRKSWAEMAAKLAGPR